MLGISLVGASENRNQPFMCELKNEETMYLPEIRQAANRYIQILNQIGAPGSDCRTDEITSLCARNCKKVRNGKILFEGREQFPSQLDAGKLWLGAWSIDVQELLIAADDRAATIRYRLSTEREGDLVVIAILYFDLKYKICEINEVHNQLEK